MILVKLSSGRQLGLSFRHHSRPQIALPKPFRYTTCYILELSSSTSTDGKQISRGQANCSTLDQFKKETGRKVALRRALADSNLSKEDRKVVWKAYHERGKEVTHETTSDSSSTNDSASDITGAAI